MNKWNMYIVLLAVLIGMSGCDVKGGNVAQSKGASIADTQQAGNTESALVADTQQARNTGIAHIADTQQAGNNGVMLPAISNNCRIRFVTPSKLEISVGKDVINEANVDLSRMRWDDYLRFLQVQYRHKDKPIAIWQTFNSGSHHSFCQNVLSIPDDADNVVVSYHLWIFTRDANDKRPAGFEEWFPKVSAAYTMTISGPDISVEQCGDVRLLDAGIRNACSNGSKCLVSSVQVVYNKLADQTNVGRD